MINSILINNLGSTDFILEFPNSSIRNLSGINVLIGPNNSGKSRFLRNLFNNTKPLDLKFIESVTTNNDYIRKTRNLNGSLLSLVREINRIGINLNNQEIIESNLNEWNSNEGQTTQAIQLLDILAQTSRESFTNVAKGYESSLNGFLARMLAIHQDLGKIISQIFLEPSTLKFLYIPVLRGLRPIKGDLNNPDVYQNRTSTDYFKGISMKNREIYTGQTIYEDIMRLLLGDETDRKNIASFETFLSENVFENKRITLIPKYKDDVLYIKIGSDLQTEIYNLGDGLQSIICILFPIYKNKNENQIVLIEEPETHLHPKWQRMLFNSLQKFNNKQYFISTHSSTFINYPESSILIFKKKSDKISILQSNQLSDKVELINQLGYKKSDFFQTNYVLWVEGPSDKIYIKKWISQFEPKLVEGEHYSIIFYGGSTYKHLFENGINNAISLLGNINQNFGIVMDSDRKTKFEKFDKHKNEICEFFKSKDYFSWHTKARTIENYIPYQAFLSAIRKVHMDEKLDFKEGDFIDRTRIQDKNNISFKKNIRLSDSFYDIIKKNDGKLDKLSSIQIKNEIENSILQSRHNSFNINKIKVANELFNTEFENTNKELLIKIEMLVNKIKAANS